MKHIEAFFKGSEGLLIHRQSWLPAKTRGTVILAHGLGEHSGRYAHVAESLVAAGLAVHALDHRGHGKSEGPRAFVDRFANAIEDMDQLITLVASEQKSKAAANQPLFLLGHSMGGALSLGYTIKYGAKLNGLVLSGPAVALDGAPPGIKPIAKVLSALLPKLGMFPIDPALVSRDPGMVASYANDPLNAHGKVPARTLGEIVRFVEWLPKQLSKITLPMLIMHGSADKLAGVAGSQMVVDSVRSADKQLKVYDGFFHEIFNEPLADRTRVLADMNAWIAERLPA